MSRMQISGKLKKRNDGGGLRLSSGTANNLNITPRPAFGLKRIGVNIHSGGTTTATNVAIATIMQESNIRHARMDLIWDGDQTMPRDMITRINAIGGSVEMTLQTAAQFNTTVHAAGSLSAVEAQAYSQAYGVVNAMKDLVLDYEILNEIQYRGEINTSTCVVVNTAQDSITPYQGKTAVASIAATMRGISHAIRDVRASSGKALRVMLGIVGRDWGFLTYMRDTESVQWDVTGFHNYPSNFTDSQLTDTWYGTGGPLTKLASFNKPYVINEFHSGEIYDANYQNSAGNALAESGYQGLAHHLRDLYSSSVGTLESITLYELFDEPAKTVPEKNFGLMFDLTTRKVSMAVATAFAGGTLDTSQSATLVSRGLISAGEITAMKRN